MRACAADLMRCRKMLKYGNTNNTKFQVEGILQNSEGGIDVETIEDFEVPTLNTFDKSQPLDDLLIRRRSLHSSPAHSR